MRDMERKKTDNQESGIGFFEDVHCFIRFQMLDWKSGLFVMQSDQFGFYSPLKRRVIKYITIIIK